MIEVKRYVNPLEKSIYENWYYYKNEESKILEIAVYNSRDDTIYINSKYLNRNAKNYLERMESSVYKKYWKELIELLNINEDTSLSEYFDA